MGKILKAKKGLKVLKVSQLENSKSETLESEAKIVKCEKEKLKTALTFLEARIKFDLDSIEEDDNQIPEDFDRNVCIIRGLMKELSDLFAQIQSTFNEDEYEYFSENYDRLNQMLSHSLSEIKSKCKEFRKSKQDEKSRIEQEREYNENELKNAKVLRALKSLRGFIQIYMTG